MSCDSHIFCVCVYLSLSFYTYIRYGIFICIYIYAYYIICIQTWTESYITHVLISYIIRNGISSAKNPWPSSTPIPGSNALVGPPLGISLKWLCLKMGIPPKSPLNRQNDGTRLDFEIPYFQINPSDGAHGDVTNRTPGLGRRRVCRTLRAKPRWQRTTARPSNFRRFGTK